MKTRTLVSLALAFITSPASAQLVTPVSSGQFRSDVELVGLAEIPSCPADIGRYGFSGMILILLRPFIGRRDG